MLDIQVIDDPAAATVALEPVRSRLLSELAAPASAATLATMVLSGPDIVTHLSQWTNELRVPDASTGKLQPSNWSFDIKTYSIRQ